MDCFLHIDPDIFHVDLNLNEKRKAGKDKME